METKPISVLVIDGDSASRNFLGTSLRNNGYKVRTESLGREGLISAWSDLPNAIILDPILPDLAGLELITRLRQDRRTSKVALVVLSGKNDPQEKEALFAAGCSEYLVKSNQTIQQLLELLAALPREVQAPQKQGCLITFLSAKGGTGTSSLCANIAMCVAEAMPDRKVAVMDVVLPIGSIAQIVGYRQSVNLVTAALQGPDPITPAYIKENLPLIPVWNFYLLAGAPDPESANRLQGNRIEEIFTAIMELYDFVFVDLGRSLSRISVPIIRKSQIISLIVSTDLATADLTKKIWQYLKTQSVNPQRIYVIQNRAVGLVGMTKGELEEMLGLSINATMPYMGDSLTNANNHHEPVAYRFQNDSAAFMLKQIAAEVIKKEK